MTLRELLVFLFGFFVLGVVQMEEASEETTKSWTESVSIGVVI